MQKKRMMDRAQITAFIIVGLLVLSSFGLVFYTVNYAQERSFQKKIDKIYSDIIQTTPIKTYVSSCVDDALEEGMRLIGRQGGVIFDYQEGSMIPKIAGMTNPKHVEYNFDNVTAVIQNFDTIAAGEIYSFLPRYPCNSYGNLGSPDTTRCGEGDKLAIIPSNPCYFIWGSVVSGSDWPNCIPSSSNPDDYDSSYTGPMAFGKKRFFALKSGNFNLRPTISEQLANYVSNKTATCVNFTGIAALTGQNITKDVPIVNVVVERDTDQVVANVLFPIVITIEGRPPVTRMVDFRATKNTRLGEIYDAVSSLTTADNVNLDVNLIDELRAKLDTDYEVEQLEGDEYDIFKITDKLYGGISGKEYVFQFARQNRWPVLDYITDDVDTYKNTVKQGKTPYYYPNDSVGYDYFVPVGTDITIRPNAYDPDEPDNNNLRFNYSGWRETYEEEFSIFEYESRKDTLGNCSFIPGNCVVPAAAGYLNNWTKSNPDFATGGPVKISTTEKDKGPHVVRVSVTDGKYTDYQDVRILVYDIETLFVRGQNEYDDIPNNFASVEDPYFLDSRGSEITCTDKLFDWEDLNENNAKDIWSFIWEVMKFNLLYSGPARFVGILNEACTGCIFNIDDVSGAFDNYGTGVLEHSIKVTIQNTNCGGSKTSQTIKVNVARCVPHRSDLAPYPFYNIPLADTIFDNYRHGGTDPFQANHACCDGNPLVVATYSMATELSNTECYHYEAYAFFPDVTKEHFPVDRARKDNEDGLSGGPDDDLIYDPSVLMLPQVNNQMGTPINSIFHSDMSLYSDPSTISDDLNDIYHRIMNQSCSGNRGNACTGNLDDKWIWQMDCPDLETDPAEQDERCFGPPIDNTCRFGFDATGNHCGQEPQTWTPQCSQYWASYNGGNISSPSSYTLRSYEKDYLQLSWADGICNSNFRLSTGPSGIYDDANGRYLCQGACGNNGCKLAVNCYNIDEYDTRIPSSDMPGSPFTPPTYDIYGWSYGNAYAHWGTIHTETTVPDPTEPSSQTWCDGECYSNDPSKVNPDSSPLLTSDDSMSDLCTARDYSPWRRYGLIPGMQEDSIIFGPQDVDIDNDYCLACGVNNIKNQNTKFIPAGEPVGEYSAQGQAGCCGDDKDEFSKFCDSSAYTVSNAPSCGPREACCNLDTDCADADGACQSQNDCYSFPPDAQRKQAYCQNSKWLDPDLDSGKCTVCSKELASEWLPTASGAQCCGDDANDDDWGTSSPINGCCCDGIKIGTGNDQICLGNDNKWCLDGNYCNREVWAPISAPLADLNAANRDDLTCGCTKTASEQSYTCEILDGDSIIDGICAKKAGSPGGYSCATNVICKNATVGEGYGYDCLECVSGNACDSSLSGSYSPDGLCLNPSENSCCTEWAAGNGVGDLRWCGGSDENNACAGHDWTYLGAANIIYCDNIALNDIPVSPAYDFEAGPALRQSKCDGSEGKCVFCGGFNNMFELAGTDPYEGDPLTCERMCNPDVNASADDKTANACDGNSGFVTSGCKYENNGDSSPQTCECRKGLGNWEDARSSGSECCDDSTDNWIFTSNTTSICNGGDMETCDSALACTKRTLEDGDYYCDGTNWIKDNNENGKQCNTNGICTPGGICCGDESYENVTNDGGTYRCGCSPATKGKACELYPILGSFSQEGICAIEQYGTRYICDKDGPVSEFSGDYYALCENTNRKCDSDITSGNYLSDGMCYGDSENCCTQNWLIQLVAGGNMGCYANENQCDSANNPAGGTSQPICIDTSQGNIGRKCDNTDTAAGGESCERCNGMTSFIDGGCESACSSLVESACDEIMPYPDSAQPLPVRLCNDAKISNARGDACQECGAGIPYAIGNDMKWYCGCVQGSVTKANCDKNRDGTIDGVCGMGIMSCS